MHPNRTFAWNDEDAMRRFVETRGFAHIFAVDEAGHPGVAHAPVTVVGGALHFHLARGNALARTLPGARAIASVTAHDAYISPDWYADRTAVPTWNYVAVEAEGPVHMLDEAGLVAQLDALSARHEAALAPKPPWTRDKMPPGRFAALLPAITGFAIAVTAWRGTRKLSQNRSEADRAGVAAALGARGADAAAELVARATR